MANRSEVMKKAWRKRKREGGKAKCTFCDKPIFARGVRMNNKPYHKGCAEAKGAGLKPAQVGKNPNSNNDNLAYFLDDLEKMVGKREFQTTAWEWSSGEYQSPKIDKLAKKYHITKKRFMRYLMSEQNPGTNWHIDRGNDLLAQRVTALKLGNRREATKLITKVNENVYAAEASRKRGMNPRRKSSERKRAPRDAFRYFGAEELNPRGRWIYPLDPDCPKVRRFSDALYGDPMTKAMGAPTDEIMEGFASKHRLTCKRCQMYGAAHVDVAYNPKFKFGPTGFRPPAKWFSKMAQGTSASYFGRKLKALTASQRAKVGQIVGGIWAKYTDATRFEILRKYEPSAVRALANPSLGKRVQMLNCPACNGLNPVSRLNVYLRCSTCGAPLRSVRVRHKR